MAQITALVKSAIGFDARRGDQVQVSNMQFAHFDIDDGAPAPKPFLGLDGAYWFKIIEAAIMCITALLIGLFVARPLINRMFAAEANLGSAPAQLGNVSPVAAQLAPPQAGSGSETAAATASSPVQIPARGPSIDVSQIDGQVRESSIKKVGEVVSAHPEEALAIIRTWLHQPV